MPPYLFVSTVGADAAMVIIDCAGFPGTSPVGILQDPSFGFPAGISVYGNYAYIPDQANDLLTIADISNLAAPFVVSQIAGAAAPNYLNAATHCQVRPTPGGLFCYVVSITDNALTVFNVDDPTNPIHRGVIQGVAVPPALSSPRWIYVDDNLRAYVAAAGNDSLTIIDVSDPTLPAYRGNIAGAGAPNFLNSPRCVQVREIGGIIYAYVISFFDDALSIFNCNNPNPTLVGTTGIQASLDEVQSLSLRGNYAYCCAQNHPVSGLAIFNIANPAAPFFVSSLVDARFHSPRGVIYPDNVTDLIWILGSNVVADSVAMVNVANPAAPAYVDWLQGSGPPNYMTTPQYITQNQVFQPIVQTDPATEIT